MIVLTRIAAALLVGAIAGAAVPARAGLSLTVEPLVQELHLAPGGSGTFTLRINNGGNETERISIERIDWTTTTEGTLRFEQAVGLKATSITRYLSLPEYTFMLAAGTSKEFPLALRLPASFPTSPATYWGGFLVRGYALGRGGLGPAATVFVYETVGKPRTHLSLNAMRVTQRGTDGALLGARVQNDGVAYARLDTRLVVEQGGRVVRDSNISTPTIFPGALRVVNYELKGLAPGQYRAELTIDYGTDVVLSGATDFSIRP